MFAIATTSYLFDYNILQTANFVYVYLLIFPNFEI